LVSTRIAPRGTFDPSVASLNPLAVKVSGIGLRSELGIYQPAYFVLRARP